MGSGLPDHGERVRGREVSEMTPPRFVIFSSYGNDSCALIQWAHENNLEGVAVVYSDTGWSSSEWEDRALRLEAWAFLDLGFDTYRTSSIGFADLAREKRGFPTQQYQWCSYRLKIEPAARWLDQMDPTKQAICLVGVRREESQGRATFPEYLPRSENHGGRFMLAPLVRWAGEDRDALLRRAGVQPLPHRSMECFPCVNSNRGDLRLLAKDPGTTAKVDALEIEIGRPLFRPHRHMGAKGIHEVLRWAESERGKFVPPEEDISGCETGFCGA